LLACADVFVLLPMLSWLFAIVVGIVVIAAACRLVLSRVS
jgi:hypothetical protein